MGKIKNHKLKCQSLTDETSLTVLSFIHNVCDLVSTVEAYIFVGPKYRCF